MPLRHVRRPISAWRDLLGLLELVVLVRRARPHIVHANSSKAGVLGRVAAWIAGAPVRVFTVHGWAFSASSGPRSVIYRWAERLVRRLTTATICVSETERAAGLAAGTCDERRTVVIRNGIDVTARPVARPETNPPRIVAVGRLQAPKDVLCLVRALAKLQERSFSVLVVGDGPDRPAIEAEIRRLGVDASRPPGRTPRRRRRDPRRLSCLRPLDPFGRPSDFGPGGDGCRTSRRGIPGGWAAGARGRGRNRIARHARCARRARRTRSSGSSTTPRFVHGSDRRDGRGPRPSLPSRRFSTPISSSTAASSPTGDSLPPRRSEAGGRRRGTAAASRARRPPWP